MMRTFLAKNGMLNHVLIGGGLIDPLQAQSMLDWRGIVVAFVWKQAPFVTLLLAGAMASLEPQHIEAARNLGARRLRVLVDIVLPQVRGTLLVGLVLSFVTMLSVLSVPMMINPNSPTMITVDIAYRINYARRLRGRQRAVPDVAGRRGGRRLVLPAAGRRARRSDDDRDAARLPLARDARVARRRARRCSRSRSSARSPTCSCGRSPSSWYFPNKLPQEFGFTFWARVFAPRGNALASLGTSVWIALLTVVVTPRGRDPRRLCARAAEAAAGAR